MTRSNRIAYRLGEIWAWVEYHKVPFCAGLVLAALIWAIVR